MRTRSLIAGGVIALSALSTGSASAEADHSDTLRAICEAHDGTFVPHPTFWRARCQGSRPSNGADDGLRAPFMICTMQMAGTFFSAPTDEEGTMNWVCL
jgi:hypothetical protein